MSKFRREHGFWAAVSGLKLKELFSAEIMIGVSVGIVIATLQLIWGNRESRVGLAGDYLAITSALLGVVFAAFALLVAFFSPAYVSLLNGLDSGIKGFLQPFLIAIGVQVVLILGIVIYRALPNESPEWMSQIGFYAVSVTFAAALMDVVALARSVLIHGVLRGKQEVVNSRKTNGG